MLRVNGIAKSYGPRRLFKGVSFILNPGEKAALVGPNGSGKSTILDIIAGLTPQSGGSCVVAHGKTLAYLRQGYEALTKETVEAAACSVVPGGLESFTGLRTAEANFGNGSSSEDRLADYQAALDLFDASGAARVAERISASLNQVGLDSVSPDDRLETLSGGQRSRVALAAIIAAEPDLLLLDEPTNHLDLPALEWLEQYVQRFSGAVLVVSHDRVFLDNTVTSVLELDTETVISHAGNYSDYVSEKDREQAARLQQWRDQEAEIRRIRADIQRMKSSARSLEGKRRPDGIPAIQWNPGRIARGMAKLAKSREVKLRRFEESEERVEKPRQRWRMKLDLDSSQRAGDMVVRLEDLSAGYGEVAVIDRVSIEAMHGERIALLGPNGTGKSTLLRIIAGQQHPGSGVARLGAGVSVGYMPQEHTGFVDGDTPLSVIRAASPQVSETECRNFLHFFLFQGDHVFTPVERLSYGERARLYLAKLVSARPNLLLLDEPLNHLDIPSRERFEEALLNYSGTTIAATHDRAFVDSWATTVWWLEPGDAQDDDAGSATTNSQTGPTAETTSDSGGGAKLRRYIDRIDMERARA